MNPNSTAGYRLRAAALMFSADLGQAQKHLKEVRVKPIRLAMFFSISLYSYPNIFVYIFGLTPMHRSVYAMFFSISLYRYPYI